MIAAIVSRKEERGTTTMLTEARAALQIAVDCPSEYFQPLLTQEQEVMAQHAWRANFSLHTLSFDAARHTCRGKSRPNSLAPHV